MLKQFTTETDDYSIDKNTLTIDFGENQLVDSLRLVEDIKRSLIIKIDITDIKTLARDNDNIIELDPKNINIRIKH